MSTNNTTLGITESTFSPSTFISANNKTEAQSEDVPRPWHIIMEIVLLGIVSGFGLVGNLLVLRDAFVGISRFARQNVVLFFSLALADLILSVLRGSILLYILTQQDGSMHDVICQVWLLSTLFVAIALLTNTALALQRLFIMFWYSKYKNCFTFQNTFIIVLCVWILFPAIGITVYKLLEKDAFFKLQHHVCVLVYDTTSFSEDHFVLTRSILVCIFAYFPICMNVISYSAISSMIKRSGVKKLNKLIGNVNFSRVIVLSRIRVALMVCLLTPFFLMVILAPRYPETFLPCMRYFDYLLILYSALSPVITLNDFDFKDSNGRRTWLSLHFGGKDNAALKNGARDERAFSICITSADLKCYNIPE